MKPASVYFKVFTVWLNFGFGVFFKDYHQNQPFADVLKTLASFTGIYLWLEFVFNKVTPRQVFSREFCEIFIEHLWWLLVDPKIGKWRSLISKI